MQSAKNEKSTNQSARQVVTHETKTKTCFDWMGNYDDIKNTVTLAQNHLSQGSKSLISLGPPLVQCSSIKIKCIPKEKF